MIKINDLGNKSFTYEKYSKSGSLLQRLFLPAVYSIRVKDNRISILSLTPDKFGDLDSDIDVSELWINGEQCQTAENAIAANSFTGSFKSGGENGSVSPEVLEGYVKEVPKPDSTSAIVKIGNEVFYSLGVASDGKTYFCGYNNNGIKVLDDETGVIGSTNITTGNFYALGIASDGKTYFISSAKGIKVLNDSTGVIENTNVTTGTYNALGIASNSKTYFCSDDCIKVLDDETGVIGSTNITTGTFFTLGIASDGKTYFLSSAKGIKVLNDSTGEIESTNVTTGTFFTLGIASDGKTYFLGIQVGIKVLNDTTGVIGSTNVTTGNYNALGIASDGKTYFCGYNSILVLNDSTGEIENTNVTSLNFGFLCIASNGKTYFVGEGGTHILEITVADEAWLRRYGEWLPAEDVLDASDTVIEGTADMATRMQNKRSYMTSSNITVKIDETVNLIVAPNSLLTLTATSGKFSVLNGFNFMNNNIIMQDPNMGGEAHVPVISPADFYIQSDISSLQVDIYNTYYYLSFVKTTTGIFKITFFAVANPMYYINFEIEKISL
jgi:streptogramin lyase